MPILALLKPQKRDENLKNDAKIILKFKDNYDFMVSKYGLDETLVYDRRNSTPVSADELWKLGKGDKKEF